MRRLLFIFLSFLLFTACKATPSGKANRAPQDNSGAPARDTSTDEDLLDPCLDSTSAQSTSLSLSSTKPNYNDDIAQLLDNHCVQCHGAGSSRDMASYAKVYSQKDSIVASVAARRMPPPSNTQLSVNQIQSFESWLANGAPEQLNATNTSTGSSSVSPSSTDGTTVVDPCEEDPSPSDEPLDELPEEFGWNAILKAQLVQKCRSVQGKIFDREYLGEALQCHKASVATSYACDLDGIIRKFRDYGVSVRSLLAVWAAQGYQIDQCGEFQGDPVVLFLKRMERGNELRIKLRELCPKGSPACAID